MTNFAKMAKNSDEWYINQVNIYPLISDSSKVNYINHIKKIKQLCGVDILLHDIFINPDIYLIKMSSQVTSNNSLQTYISTILTCMKCSGTKEKHKDSYSKWTTKLSELSKKIQEKVDTNIPNEKQVDNYVEWKDIVKARTQLNPLSDEYLLLCLYTLIPPRRVQEYSDIRVYTNPKYTPKLDHNHIHIFSNEHESPYMFLNKYKT